MRRPVIVALCWVVLAAFAAPSGAQTVLYERRVGKWTLSAMAEERFSACGLAVFNDRGTSLGLALHGDGTGEISFRNSSWDLPEEGISLTYGIDRKPGLQTRAAVRAGEMAEVALRRDVLWFDQIAAGRSLYVRILDEVHAFDLAGLAPLVPILFDCVKHYRNERVAPALVPAVRPALGIEAARAQAMRWVERLAAEGAMPRGTLLTSEEKADPEMRAFLEDAAIGWQNRAIEMVGRLAVLMPHPDPLSTMAWDLIERSTANCDGDYTVIRGGRDDGIIGIYTDCNIKGKRLRLDYVLFKDRNGYLYWASFVGTRPDRAGDIDPVAEDFRRAAVALLARP